MPSHTMIFVLLALVMTKSAFAADGLGMEDSGTEDTSLHQVVHAALYPSFILTIGVIAYFVFSRYLHYLQYTAMMFIIGTLMGFGIYAEQLVTPDCVEKHECYMTDTVKAWTSVDSELLLNIFLPGLIFKDALGQNPYLFSLGFGQIFIFAFPCVLAGTFLTGLVAFYALPNQWPFFLCLTFGSILSATDPVAVSALLAEVGAPPRLTTHIAGESLLNDGAAIVFFAIFKDIYFHGIGIEGFGREIDVAEGVKIFVQKAIGGSAIGAVAGGAIVLVLWSLNRRHCKEENVVQVTAVLGLVYLNFFVAEIVCDTSGVIATLSAGLFVKFFGRVAINDNHLMDSFFNIIEHVLNTILFSIGGLLWGNITLSNHNKGFQSGVDWGYLLLLYLLLHVIRAALFVAVYPITSRIGLKTNWRETVFQIYGGLRGSVGIALALYLHDEIIEYARDDGYDMVTEEEDVSQVYFMVGGIAFLTLLINGATAGPILKELGLGDTTTIRKKIIEVQKVHLREAALASCVKLLTQERFKFIDFSFVQRNIPFLSNLKLEQVAEAVLKMKETTESKSYSPPYLKNILPILGDGEHLSPEEEEVLKETPEEYARKRKIEMRKLQQRKSAMQAMMKKMPLSTKEMRLLFISILRAQYEHLMNEGLIGSKHGLSIVLVQSLEFAKSDVNSGKKLNDLYYVRKWASVVKLMTCCGKYRNEFNKLDAFISLEFAFTISHTAAQRIFQDEVGGGDSDLSEGGKVVLAESISQVKEVQKDLSCEEREEIVCEISTCEFCNIILTQSIGNVEELVAFGLLKESEAEEIINELTRLSRKLRHATFCGGNPAGQETHI